MTLGAATIWEINSLATTGNVNGGGFNTANANMLTDLAADAGTGNTSSPVVSSASYNFVTGDVGNWLYIQSGTNWIAGFYKIASVASNKATLSAAIGAADIFSNGFYGANTAVGCATVGTPTGGIFSIDYSRSLACITSTAVSDYAATGASTTLTSATAAFTPVMAGNIFYQSTTGTGAFGTIGRYEIVTYVSSTSVTLDRTPNNGTNSVATTGKIGGAVSLDNSSTNIAFLATPVAGNIIYIVGNSTYTLATGIGTVSGTLALPISVVGYVTRRGDNPTGSSRPLFNMVTASYGPSATSNVYYMNFTSSGQATVLVGNFVSTKWFYCKSVNTSTTAGRDGYRVGNYPALFYACEGVSYRGNAFNYNTITGAACLYACYAHDSNVCFNEGAGNSNYTIANCISMGSITAAANISTATTSQKFINNNTIIGRPTSKTGSGLTSLTGSGSITVTNNIITDFSTGINITSPTGNNYGDYNDFYNNTTDVTNWNKGPNDIASNPQLTSVVERNGSTATTIAGNHLTQIGATFVTWGITAGQDCIYISAGTGVTAGIYGILSVDSETQITLDIGITANATADKVWSIVQGKDYSIGINLRGAGYPGVFPGTVATGYPDIGAVQRQEGASGGTPAWAS